GHHVTNAANGVELLIGLAVMAFAGGGDAFQQRLDRTVMARQQFGVGLADMADAKRIDQAVERDLAALLDRIKQIPDRDLTIAFAIGEFLGRAFVARGEREDIGGLHDDALAEKLLDLLLAETLDVERIARHEMADTFHGLRRANETAGAA